MLVFWAIFGQILLIFSKRVQFHHYLSKKMEKADNFGDLLAKNIKIGDLVSWSTWNSENFDWDINLGIVLEIKNTILSNRMVCVSTVVPLKDPYGTRELFTFALKVVPSAGETKV